MKTTALLAAGMGLLAASCVVEKGGTPAAPPPPPPPPAAAPAPAKAPAAAPKAAPTETDAARVLEASRKKQLAEFERKGLDTAPEDAQFLRILVESSRAKYGVEIGSYKGYGAIHMGMAFERNGGRLVTHEIDPKIADECRANVKKAGLEDTVTVVTGDALQTMARLENGIDFVFIDAKKDDYFKYFKLLEPKLRPGAVIVADNTIQSAKAMPDYLEYVNKNPDYDSVTIRASLMKNDGMTVTYKLR
jgi:predicted O-methyltransferase YrrM